MFAEERLDKILNLLNSEGKIKVKNLSQHFNVTEDCIRKDLKQLENLGHLKRTYGGAIKVRQSTNQYDTIERSKTDVSSKAKIAQKAFNLIKDRETIFLDLSTINMLIAKLLSQSNKRVTVVTNMIDIINILSSTDNNVTVIATGGLLNKSLNGFAGATAINFVEKYKFDISFIGSCGIDVFDKSITTFEIEDGLTKTAIIRSSKKTFLVMQQTKFNIDGNYKFSNIESINGIITDTLPSIDIIDILHENNITII